MVFQGYSADEARNSAYACIAVLTVFILDWIYSIDEEVEIMTRGGLNIPITIYHASRVTTLAFCILGTVTNFGTVGLDFRETSFILWGIRWACSTSTSLLFFLRMRAVYYHSRPIMTMFAVLWVLIVLTPIAGLFGIVQNCGGPICQHWNRLALPMDLSIFLHDTLVFLCISYKIYGDTFSSAPLPRSRSAKVRQFFSRKGLHAVSKALLLGGQLYYAVTIGVLMVCAVAIQIDLPYSDTIGLFYLALSGTLACRVFRMLMLCNWETEDAGVSTRVIEEMVMAVMERTEAAQGASNVSDAGSNALFGDA